MIYFSTAIYYEAAPIIEKYNMKKLTEVSQFQVFKGDNASLIISGVGGTSSAIAAAFMLAMSKASEKDFFVNIGVCAAADLDYKTGDVVLCNKLINEPMGKIFFPDMLFSHPFKEAALLTCAKPVSHREDVLKKAAIADMEGAFAYEAASRFIPPHKIFTVKVVSDMCEPEKVTPDKVKELMYEAVEKFLPWLEQIEKFSPEEKKEVLSSDELEMINLICKNLKFSLAMTLEFEKLARQYKVRCGGLAGLLESHVSVEAKSRAEGKKHFSKIKEILLS